MINFYGDRQVMEKAPTLRKQLTVEIRSNQDASKVVNSFREAYKNISECDLICFRRLFLCAATKYGHTTLLNLLLSKPKFCDLDSVVKFNIPRPLFVAIETGNASLVESFLRAGSSVTLKGGAPENGLLSTNEMTAIEYACTFDRPEIFKLLVSYDTDKAMQRFERFSFTFVNETETPGNYISIFKTFMIDNNSACL